MAKCAYDTSITCGKNCFNCPVRSRVQITPFRSSSVSGGDGSGTGSGAGSDCVEAAVVEVR
jgi:hypothetical protein